MSAVLRNLLRQRRRVSEYERSVGELGAVYRQLRDSPEQSGKWTLMVENIQSAHALAQGLHQATQELHAERLRLRQIAEALR